MLGMMSSAAAEDRALVGGDFDGRFGENARTMRS
jgi:hypothetical protein